MPAAVLPYGLLASGALGLVLGVILANWFERRRLARERAEELKPFLEPIEPLPLQEIEPTDTWVSLGSAANNVVNAAAILRRETAPNPLPEAAE